MAPDLVQILQEFSREDVRCIGLTSQEDEAEDFLAMHGYIWPNAVVTTETVSELRRAMTSETTPDLRMTMVILVDPDGRILWTDDADRWRHQHEDWPTRLRQAISAALLSTAP